MNVERPRNENAEMESHHELAAIAAAHGSPFYVFHGDVFAANLRELRHAFERRYPRLLIGYSYKTNYLPELCAMARDLGAYAEVVSRLEYDLALAIGHEPSTIIFNGPLKTAEDLELALEGGSVVNLDGFSELGHVIRYARRERGRPVPIGLRINIDLCADDGRSHIQEGLARGRFGFPESDLDRVDALLADAPGVKVHSLHGHTSSSSRAAWIYERIARSLVRLAEHRYPRCEYINLGGGMYGKLPAALGVFAAPTFDDYAEAACGPLSASDWVRERKPYLVLEPGVAVAANALSYVTRIVDVKQIGEQVLALVDGSAMHIKPSLHRKNQPFELVTTPGAARQEQVVSVTGATCMEKDYLLCEVPMAPAPGDFLCISHVGAYSMSMSPPFILPPPAIVSRQGARVRVLRRRYRFDDVFSAYAGANALASPPRDEP